MRITVLSCSPKGEASLTLQSANFLKKFFPQDEFNVFLTTGLTCPDEVVDSATDADLIMIFSSIFHLNVHAQMLTMLDDFVSKLRTRLGNDFDKKFFTYVTTSNFLYDVGAHRYVTRWAEGEKLNFLRLLSLKDESMLSEKGHEELYRWFSYTKDTIELLRSGNVPQVTEKRRVAIVNDGLPSERVNKIVKLYEERGCDCEAINIYDYKLTPCTACFACYSNRTCCMKDDFEALVDKVGTGADLVINMGKLRYGMLSQQFKIYTDRHVQFGRCGNSEELVTLSLLESDEDDLMRQGSLADFCQWETATSGIGSYYYAGAYFMRIKDQEIDVTRQIDDTILIMNNEMIGQRSFYSETLKTRFAELAHLLQFMCPLDFAHYKKEGYYGPRPINTNVKYINDVKSGKMSCTMRLMAYNETLASVGEVPKLTKRRKYKDMSYVDHMRKGDADGDKSEKGGLFGLFGKKK